MRRTSEEANATREAILKAAQRLFGEKGYSDTGLEEIAAAAGVTRGAVYHHFEGKPDLFNELIRERYSRAAGLIAEIMARHESPLATIRLIVRRSLEYLEEDEEFREVQRMLIFKTPVLPEMERGLREKADGIKRYLELLRGIVDAGLACGEIRAGVDPLDVARAIIGFVNGVTMLWLFDTAAFSIRERAGALAALFVEGLCTGRRESS